MPPKREQELEEEGEGPVTPPPIGFRASPPPGTPPGTRRAARARAKERGVGAGVQLRNTQTVEKEEEEEEEKEDEVGLRVPGAVVQLLPAPATHFLNRGVTTRKQRLDGARNQLRQPASIVAWWEVGGCGLCLFLCVLFVLSSSRLSLFLSLFLSRSFLSLTLSLSLFVFVCCVVLCCVLSVCCSMCVLSVVCSRVCYAGSDLGLFQKTSQEFSVQDVCEYVCLLHVFL